MKWQWILKAMEAQAFSKIQKMLHKKLMQLRKIKHLDTLMKMIIQLLLDKKLKREVPLKLKMKKTFQQITRKIIVNHFHLYIKMKELALERKALQEILKKKFMIRKLKPYNKTNWKQHKSFWLNQIAKALIWHQAKNPNLLRILFQKILLKKLFKWNRKIEKRLLKNLCKTT